MNRHVAEKLHGAIVTITTWKVGMSAILERRSLWQLMRQRSAAVTAALEMNVACRGLRATLSVVQTPRSSGIKMILGGKISGVLEQTVT
jgi:hypothetical protein